ncbi:Uncharacterised protein [Acinetobacter baumannii]|nr:Uncharacterised protein [Acinetobacter baumannii]
MANVSFARQRLRSPFWRSTREKGVAFPTDGREAFDSLSNPFNSHLSGNFRLFDSSFYTYGYNSVDG